MREHDARASGEDNLKSKSESKQMIAPNNRSIKSKVMFIEMI